MKDLKHLTIQNFKSIGAQVSIDIRPINVLIGPNGAGKSNFIEVFRLLGQIIDKNLQGYVAARGGADRMLHFGRRTAKYIKLRVDFPPNSYECVLIPTDDNRLVFDREIVSFSGDRADRSAPLASRGDTESKLADTPEPIAQHAASAMRRWTVYHFHDTSSVSPLRGDCRLTDAWPLSKDGSNLAAYLRRLRSSSPRQYDRFLGVVRLVAPFIRDFALEPNAPDSEFIRLKWRHQGVDDLFDVADLSDGTLRFTALAALLLEPRNSDLLIIDEPELGLHPHAINLFAELVSDAARRCRVVLATQSVTLVNQFTTEDIIVLDRAANSTALRRCDAAQLQVWLDDYALGEIWEKDLIGGSAR